MDSWKIAFASAKQFEVHFAKNYLESEGIETLLENELPTLIYSNVTDITKLLVKERDLEQATKILIERGYLKI